MNRKQRRMQLKAAGMLRVKNMYGPFTEVGKLWYARTAEQGAKLHAQNLEKNARDLGELLAQKEADIIESHKSHGFNDEQIKLMMEAWRLTAIKYDDTYRKDRKKAMALYKKASQIK